MLWESEDRIAHYRIERYLGSGGMSTVYLAEDTRLERLVALKFLSEAYTYDNETRERFLQEARAAAMMDHPNIAAIHDLRAVDEQTFIVMPFYQGQGLDDIIADARAKRTFIPLKRVMQLIMQAAAGLREAHQHGIIHRDIKPSNLFVTREGIVKILDFGVAQMADANVRLTASSMIGTPAYMPPEQVRGKRVNQQADLWALGVVFYELLTNVNPFRREDGLAATLLSVVKEDPPQLAHYRVGLPHDLDDVLRRLLCKNVSERCLSAEAFLDALQAIDMTTVTQETTTLALGTAPPETVRTTRQRRAVSANHNLPQRLGQLYGREDELALVDINLADEDCRILTILAQGGTGKTRLSLAAAHSAHASSHFEGVYFVPLEHLSHPTQIAPAIAEVLGVNVPAGTRPLEQVIDTIASQSLLLVLDNFEHLVEGAAQLDTLTSACEHLKLLVTSRARLNLEVEWVVPLAGLSYPGDEQSDVSLTSAGDYAAVQLFEARAKRSQLNFVLAPEDVPAVLQISRLVHGLPLGLELAAAWVTTLSCGDIAAEIARNMDFLETRSRNRNRRHQSIRAVFEHSWALLDAADQDALTNVAAFHGGFDEDAAHAVAGVQRTSLDRAVDKSLLQRNHGRYRFHPLLSQYVTEKLQERDVDGVLAAKHAHYYLAQLEHWFGRVLSTEQATMLTELNRDIDNHYAAWAWAQQHEPEHFIRATDPMMFVHSLQGRLHEGRQLFQTTLSALQRPEPTEKPSSKSRRDPRSRVAALFADLADDPLAGVMASAGSTADTEAADTEAADTEATDTEAIDSRLERVQAYLKQALAWFEEHAGRAQIAFEHCRQALTAFRSHDDSFGLMRSLTLLADMRLRQGKLELAETLLNEALTLAEDSYPGESSMLLNKLGDLYLAQDDLARAADTYNRSVSATNSNQGSASPIINVNNYRGLGRIALERRQWRAARDYFEQSLTLARTAQFRLREPYILTQLALVYAAPDNTEINNTEISDTKTDSTKINNTEINNANLEHAWQLLHEAAAIAKERGQQGSLALTYAVMGDLATRATPPSDAEPAPYYWLESLRSAWRQRDVSAVLHALLALVHLTPAGTADPDQPESHEALQQLEQQNEQQNNQQSDQQSNPRAAQRAAIIALICQHPATSPEDRQHAQTLPHSHAAPSGLEEAVRYFWPDAPTANTSTSSP